MDNRGDANWLTLDQVLSDILKPADPRPDGQTESKEGPRVAFAISGGGATGAYQAGVIKAYLAAIRNKRWTEEERERLKPRIIVGTSAGALNALILLIERLGLEDPAVRALGEEPYVTTLWRVIGEGNRGARLVVGRWRAVLIDLATRWSKNARVMKAILSGAGLVLLLLFNPLLAGWLLARLDYPFTKSAAHFIDQNARVVSLGSSVLALLLVAALFILFRRALFSNRALSGTLANAVRDDQPAHDPRARLERPVSQAHEALVSQRLARTWYARHETNDGDAPEFILTATDLCAKGECLFTLVSPTTYYNLAVEHWQVAQIGARLAARPGEYAPPPSLEGLCAVASESDLIRCAVASTSIPSVFPSQRITVHRLDDGRAATHDFVDGGVLNNAPIHIAIDAGATRVVSIELNPLADPGPLEPVCDAPACEPRIVGNLVQTFETLLTLATGEDIRGAAAWNERIKKGLIKTAKPLVRIYRVAPIVRKVDTIEFNGHYDEALCGASPSLVGWMEQGYMDASTAPIFWNATFDAYPEEPPPVGR